MLSCSYMDNVSTNTFEPIPIYREGVFDRRYWYTLQAKRYLSARMQEAVHTIDVLFEEHRLEITH